MKQQCIQCSRTFIITDRDQEFYNRLNVPPPTHCPDCRAQRRLSWRNERFLYQGACAACQKSILSVYHPGSDLTVYCQECYRSDTWDARHYGREIDWSQPFFQQFTALYKAVPKMSTYSIRSENSEYCNYVGDAKNSYLCFGSIVIEDCLYGSPYYSKQCIDSLLIRECELCYECITCERLYHCFWCQDCFDSRDLISCYDVKNSADCIGSAGLRNAHYMIFNKQHTEAEYRRFRGQLNFCDLKAMENVQQEFERILLKTPRRFMIGVKNEDVSGNYINESKAAYYCFDVKRIEHCSYAAQVIDLKDCYDINYTEENELCYEYWGNYRNHHCIYSSTSYGCSDLWYCMSCEFTKQSFGCVGLRKAEYCILNKSVGETEYHRLVPKLIAHMKQTREWGEFFSIQHSPFAYNESVAQEYYPLTEEQVKQFGWRWLSRDTRQYQPQTYVVPEQIVDVADDITDAVLACQNCHRNYNLIQQELNFYKAEGIPIPRVCPNCRHLARMKKRTDRALWQRQCMCTQTDHGHKGRCRTEFSTAYDVNSKAIVYCEACYQKTIY